MSQAIINELPAELLSQVFDLLCFNDRQSATTVCSRWSDILSEARYLRRTTFHLVSYISQGHPADEVRHYPVVEIGIVTEEKDLHQIREFLFSEQVASNLVAIHLNKFNHSMGEIFENFPTYETTLNLPKLEEIKFERCVQRFSQPKIIAPRLKTLELISHNSHYAGDMVMPFVDQIEEMNLFTSITVCGRFLSKATNLRRCTLHNYGMMQAPEIDAFKKAFRTLEKLNIDLPGEYAIKNLQEILQIAQNLKSLTITSSNFNISLLPSLENLQTLDLLSIPAQRFETTEKLNLPNLWNLRTIVSATKKFIVPNLRSLTLLGDFHTILRAAQIKQFFRQFSHQLEELDLLDVVLRRKCIDLITALPKVKHLMLYKVQVDDFEVAKLIEGMKSLRMARFVNCFPYTAMAFYCNCYDYREFFEGLREKYVDCSVIVVTNEVECEHCEVISDDSDYY